MICRALMILVIIGSFPIVSTLQLPPKATAQIPPSEAAKVLVDDVIQALKANDISKARVHLNILNQQLQGLGNSSSVQSTKVLLDDANAALKKNDTKGALVHLSLISQLSFGNNTSSGNTIPSKPKPSPTMQIAKNRTNHPPEAFGQTIVVDKPESRSVDLRGNDIDGDPIVFSTTSNPAHGQLASFNPNTGFITYTPNSDYVGQDSFSFQVIDNHNTKSNIAQVSIVVGKTTPVDDLSQPTKTVDLNINGMTYPIKYDITGDGNSVTGISTEANTMTYDTNDYSLILSLDTQSDGKLTIDLPRNIIDSEGPYNVLYKGHASSANEIKNNAKVRTLEMDFQQGTNQIEIQGGKLFARISDPYTGSRGGVPPGTPFESQLEPSPLPPSTSEPNTDHNIHKSKRGGHEERGPVGGYDTGFAVGAERANEAVNQFDNGQLKGIDADKSPPCPAVDEGNGYCRGFHDGWRKTVLDRLD